MTKGSVVNFDSNEITIIKLGGAAITDKLKTQSSRSDVIRSVVSDLSNVKSPLIVIHGAGSFAHNFAKEYDLANGISNHVSVNQQLEGISRIRISMQKLHIEIISQLESAGLHPFSLPVSSTLISKGSDEIHQLFVEPYIHALNLGFVPVSFGDMSFDVNSKYRVISGDRIMKLLVTAFQNQETHSDLKFHIIFGSDVDGLYDRPPDDVGANFIPEIKRHEIDKYIQNAGASAGIDVTGGMKGKLLEIKEMLEIVDKIDIVNITVPKRLKELLNGESTIYTRIT